MVITKSKFYQGSHIGTGIKPLLWTVPDKPQKLYELCNCKYSKAPPYCDATHTNLPLKILEQQKNCTKDHSVVEKLCNSCGYKK
jgi:CDGSH-type Zn-finger protein